MGLLTNTAYATQEMRSINDETSVLYDLMTELATSFTTRYSYLNMGSTREINDECFAIIATKMEELIVLIEMELVRLQRKLKKMASDIKHPDDEIEKNKINKMVSDNIPVILFDKRNQNYQRYKTIFLTPDKFLEEYADKKELKSSDETEEKYNELYKKVSCLYMQFHTISVLEDSMNNVNDIRDRINHVLTRNPVTAGDDKLSNLDSYTANYIEELNKFICITKAKMDELFKDIINE